MRSNKFIQALTKSGPTTSVLLLASADQAVLESAAHDDSFLAHLKG